MRILLLAQFFPPVIGGEERYPYVYHMDRPKNMKIADDTTLIRKIDRQEGPIFALDRSSDGARIAVAGLNPHAGENGLFGTEEIEAIIPAIEACRRDGINVSGPFPGDTIFVKAARGAYDVVIACYHDQGLIPVKLLAFGRAVNVTLGLPIVRTSVDHGTAFDIAWQGKANAENLLAAVRLAARLALPAESGKSSSPSL